MASSPPNPRDEEQVGERAEAGSQKRFVAPSAAQLPSRLQYVQLPGPAGVKSTFRTVKVARRVPTLPRKLAEPAPGPSGADAGPGPPPQPPEPPRRARRDQTKRHACDACSKRFTSPGKLSQHLLSHTGELPFPCEFCEKRFNSKFKLARHNLIHSESRAFACNVCGKTFNRKDHLTNHVRVHNPVKKLFTCDKPHCRKSYTSLLSYRKHAALHSVEEGDLQCKICDKVFTERQDIIYHLKIHTGSRTVKSETDKKFTCDYCERRFFTAKDVRRHQVVHTGRRDFLCPHCPQKFGRKDHLVRHVKNAHPEESWRSAAAGPSSEPPEASAFEETYTAEFPLETTEFIWKADSPKPSTSKAIQTPVPSSDIIVELPAEPGVKLEPGDEKADPAEIKLEEPPSPSALFPLVYVVEPEFPQPPELPFIDEDLSHPLDSHLLDPGVELFDPGPGPAGVLRGLLEEPYTEEGVARQRLPAFTQAFQAQGSKPPPPPPPL